jgi:uncharacterized small protein (DUF1192 family)
MTITSRLDRLERGDDRPLSEAELRNACVRVAQAFDVPVQEVADELRETLALPRAEIARLYAELPADDCARVAAALRQRESDE